MSAAPGPSGSAAQGASPQEEDLFKAALDHLNLAFAADADLGACAAALRHQR